jgi:hypothetical protein
MTPVINTLEVPFLIPPTEGDSLREVARLLDQAERHPLQHGWFHLFPYRPDVRFSISHANDRIFLKFFVREQALLARFHSPNDPVYKDSCVEFFVAFDTRTYYNLEFNCLGTCLMEAGADRHHRLQAPDSVISQVKSDAVIRRDRLGVETAGVAWELTLEIPVTAFWQHDLSSLSSLSVRGNFQKCGDDLAVPHFLSWNPIPTPEPDFHQPQFMGGLHFRAQ